MQLKNSKFRGELLERRCLLTSVSPVPLTDVSSATQSAEFGDFHGSGDRLFFELDEAQLWVTEGTVESTRKVADVVPHSTMLRALNVDFFNVETEAGFSMWQTDGSAAGTFEVLPGHRIPTAHSFSDSLRPFAQALGLGFVTVEVDGGFEIWAFDGKSAATRLQISAEEDLLLDSFRLQATTEHVFLYGGSELYSLDPDTLRVELIHDRVQSFSGSFGRSKADTLFFSVKELDRTESIYVTDGTRANTELSFSSTDGWLPPVVYNDQLIVFAQTESADMERVTSVYATDGTEANMELLAVVGEIGRSIVTNDRLYFFASSVGDVNTSEEFPSQFLWTSDGSPGGTESLADVGYSFLPRSFIRFNDDVVLFSGSAGISRTDGTVAGTFDLFDFGFNTFRPSVERVGEVAGWTYFLVHDTHRITGYRTDGENADSLPIGNESGFGFQADNGELVFSTGYTTRNGYVVDTEGNGSFLGGVFSFESHDLAAASNEWYISGIPGLPLSPEREHPITEATGFWYSLVWRHEDVFTSSGSIDLLDTCRQCAFIDGASGRRDADPLFFTTEGSLFAVDQGIVELIHTDPVRRWVPIDGALVYVKEAVEDESSSLYVSDGTADGTHEVVLPTGETLMQPQLYKWLDSAIVIVDTAEGGRELWLLEPTESPVQDELRLQLATTFTVVEGQDLSLAVSSPVEGLSYEWDINNDGQFGDVSGTTSTVPWQQIQDLAREQQYRVSVMATDSSGRTQIANSSFRILNLAPTELSISVPDTIIAGVPFTVTAAANDVGPLLYSISAFNVSTPAQSSPEFSITIDEPNTGQSLFLNVDDGQSYAPSLRVRVEVLPAQTDLDANGQVNFADFLILTTNFGASNPTAEMGDINKDGVIDLEDYLLLQQDFGENVAI